jgi:hypothetical protein
MADMLTLKEAKTRKSPSPSSSSHEASSDDGLPPPLPPSQPKGFSLGLNLGGLGLSTIAKEGEKTAE